MWWGSVPASLTVGEGRWVALSWEDSGGSWQPFPLLEQVPRGSSKEMGRRRGGLPGGLTAVGRLGLGHDLAKGGGAGGAVQHEERVVADLAVLGACRQGWRARVGAKER